MFFQENLDSFLAIAEELQLKGLMEKSEGKLDRDFFPTKCPENPSLVATKIERTNVQATRIESNTVAIKGDVTDDFSQLDAQIESMMENSPNLARNRVCKVCGKDGMKNDIKKHIEANYLEGLSFPYNFCEKSCRSRKALWMHRHKNHRFL